MRCETSLAALAPRAAQHAPGLLRAVSTRAVITPSGCTNHHEWGDLKADPAEWMRRYCDALVCSGNWHTCQLSL
jgi:hypothetical protein